MLQISLEYQKAADYSDKFETYIFIDPHSEHGIVSDYDKVITNEFNRIDWTQNSGKYSWYDAVKYIFDNTNYNYVLSIEDDVLISKDYLRLCQQLHYDEALTKDDTILYFHIGAWGQTRGDVNRIVRSQSSIRSSMIHKTKFYKYVQPYYENYNVNKILGLDLDLQKILDINNLTTIAPEANRHGHIGVYGWSATNKHADNTGKISVFGDAIGHNELYQILNESCLSGDKLRKLNQNKNPDYFWNFDPDINFTQLKYDL
jgi:hypothetical protein